MTSGPHLSDSVTSLPGVGAKRAECLARLGIETVGDLLRHAPRASEDRGHTGVADYLRFIDTAARAGFDAGADPLDVARDADLGRFAEWHDSERIVGNLHRAYSELRGEERGAPIDAQA